MTQSFWIKLEKKLTVASLQVSLFDILVFLFLALTVRKTCDVAILEAIRNSWRYLSYSSNHWCHYSETKF